MLFNFEPCLLCLGFALVEFHLKMLRPICKTFVVFNETNDS